MCEKMNLKEEFSFSQLIARFIDCGNCGTVWVSVNCITTEEKVLINQKVHVEVITNSVKRAVDFDPSRCLIIRDSSNCCTGNSYVDMNEVVTYEEGY